MARIILDRTEQIGCLAGVVLRLALLSSSLCGCADVLGIPREPRLIDGSGATPVDLGSPLASNTSLIDAPDASHETPLRSSSEELVLDGVLPAPSDLLGATTTEPREHGDAPPVTAGADAGLAPPTGDALAEPDLGCTPGSIVARVPLDIVMVVDNSGSMGAATEAVEGSLGAFAASLEDRGVDFRIILMSRHRVLARTASDAAGTSVCVESPLSGLESCPSARPVPSERFFHYSVKIDASDSFTRLLETYAAPDAFGLAPTGWSGWLRVDSRKVFIEITDADADLDANEFVAQLSALGPEYFGADPARPSFVFHSLVGVRDKLLGSDVYAPDEPIETRTCRSVDINPDNAGEAYQALSRLTGGLRLPLCPATGIGSRLADVAASLVLASAHLCPADGVQSASGS